MFEKYKNKILGRGYELSVVFVSPTKIRALNKQYRNINKPTDILAFPLSKKSGEIILCKSEVAKHAKLWDLSSAQYLPFLVIHGMLHLKGLVHGRIMEAKERQYCRLFGVQFPRSLQKTNGTTTRSRNRRRYTPRARRRIAGRRE